LIFPSPIVAEQERLQEIARPAIGNRVTREDLSVKTLLKFAEVKKFWMKAIGS
jgi:hypothetical protein